MLANAKDTIDAMIRTPARGATNKIEKGTQTICNFINVVKTCFCLEQMNVMFGRCWKAV